MKNTIELLTFASWIKLQKNTDVTCRIIKSNLEHGRLYTFNETLDKKIQLYLSFFLSLECMAKCCKSSTYATALIVIAIKQDNGLF